jgi:16S rRNA (cytidine1402-2'-O)-methyltransferase
LAASLRLLAAVDPDRQVAVCRELTKRFEEVVRGTAAELAARYAEPPKGEITLVVAGGQRQVDEAAALAAVAELVASGLPRKRAAALVAGLARNRLYRGSL